MRMYYERNPQPAYEPGDGGYVDYLGGGYHTPQSAAMMGSPQFSGISIFPSVTLNGDGTVTVGGNGEYCLYSQPNGRSTVSAYGAPGGIFTMVDQSANFIYVDYNNGVPIVRSTTDRSIIAATYWTTKSIIVTVYRDGLTLTSLEWGETALAQPEKIMMRMIHTQRFAWEYGLALSDAGSQRIGISGGAVWYGLKNPVLSAVNSATAPTYLYSHTGGAYSDSAITTFNNTQYQGPSGLVTLTANRYAVNWVYKGLGSAAGQIAVMLGTGDYKLYDALASQPPTPPDAILKTHILVGRIIVQKGVAAAAQVDSAFAVEFNTSSQLLNYFDENIVFGGQTGEGIQVDLSAPTFPWRDLVGNIHAKGTGATDPSWATYRGGIKGYQFTVNDEVWLEFHLPHDYVPGSDIFIHAHWSYTAASMTSGGVTWAFETTAARGHQQESFAAPVTPTVAQTAIVSGSGGQYRHHIAEAQLSAASPSGTQIANSRLEPDSIILVRCYLSANTLQGTPEPFLHYVDLHYQSTGIGTKNKAPGFYAA